MFPALASWAATMPRIGRRFMARIDAARSRIMSALDGAKPAAPPGGSFCASVTVSMRRVAGELGASTMSLYRHVADKDDLLTRMMEAVMSEWSFPDDPPPGWRGHVEVAARTLWAAFRRHPWLAPARSLTWPQPLAGAVPYAESVLSALDGHGLDVQTVWTTYITVFNYVRGTAVNLEMEAEAEAVSGLSGQEWMEAQEPALRHIVAGGRFPTLERFIRADYDVDIDALFEFGLQRLLDGVATLCGDRS